MEKSKCNSWIILKVQKVKPDTWKKIVQVQRFVKKEDSRVFFANGPSTFKAQLYNC